MDRMFSAENQDEHQAWSGCRKRFSLYTTWQKPSARKPNVSGFTV
jgi:hypothetical protein